MLPELEFEAGGHSQKMSTRIVVGADGRDSSIPAWAGLSMQQDPDRNLVVGVLLESLEHSEDTAHVWLGNKLGHFGLHFPQGQVITRTFLCQGAGSLPRLNGQRDTQCFWRIASSPGFLPMFIPRTCKPAL